MKTRIRESLKLLIIALVTATATSFFFIQHSANYTNETADNTAPKVEKWYSQLPFSTAATTDFTNAAERSVNAVVHVKVKTFVQNNYSGNSLFDFFFGNTPQQQQRPVEGFGSGVILSEDGYIVTNNHVINKSNEIEVVLNDKRTYTAKLIGTDPMTDLALLKVDAEALPTLSFGNSDNLKIGEWVLAVGNPFNLSTTVTAGIVSAKARGIGISASQNGQLGIESFIQTDAAVNPGNSGGALVNTSGQLIGINSAIASPTGSYAGYSFAIPVSIVRKVVADLMEFGKVQRALLGVEIADITSDLAHKKNLDILDGVYIANVFENSTADEADLQEGDVITSINKTKTNSVSELQEQVNRYRPGDEVELGYIRNGKKRYVSVKFKNSQGSTLVIKDDNLTKLGASFEVVSDEEKAKLGLKFGVKVVSLTNGKLLRSGVRENFIITTINNVSIKTIDDISKTLNNIKDGMFISGLYPNGQKAYYAIDINN